MQAGLFSTGERAGILFNLVAEQEVAEHGPQRRIDDTASDAADVIHHGDSRSDLLVLLGVVAERCLVTELHLTDVSGLLTRQDSQQRRFARTVESHDYESLAALDEHVDVDEHHVVIERLGEPDTFEGIRPDASGCGNCRFTRRLRAATSTSRSFILSARVCIPWRASTSSRWCP